MALCRDCSTPIPCHCHISPAAEVRPGIYPAVQRPGASQTTEVRTKPDAPTNEERTFV